MTVLPFPFRAVNLPVPRSQQAWCSFIQSMPRMMSYAFHSSTLKRVKVRSSPNVSLVLKIWSVRVRIPPVRRTETGVVFLIEALLPSRSKALCETKEILDPVSKRTDTPKACRPIPREPLAIFPCRLGPNPSSELKAAFKVTSKGWDDVEESAEAAFIGVSDEVSLSCAPVGSSSPTGSVHFPIDPLRARLPSTDPSGCRTKLVWIGNRSRYGQTCHS